MTIQQSLSFILFLIYLQLPSNSIGQQTAASKYFLEKTQIEIKPFSFQSARNGHLIASNLDQFRDLYAMARQLVTQQYYRDYKSNYKFMLDTGKLQPQISQDEKFPCDLNHTRSAEPPRSVYKLRPGDIDIIGAMGDSLTAGTGIMAKNLLQLIAEFRGQTALGGGLKDWRTFLTLPNILKVYNPSLYGYSVANTLGKSREARFNTAEPFAVSQDMPYMAQVLIKRMQTDPNVNMTKHWKMISIFIGANEICSHMCYFDKTEDFLENHRKDIYRTLTILRDNIPRLMVNMVIVPDIYNVLRHMKNIPVQCKFLHIANCGCLLGNPFNSQTLDARHEVLRRLQQIDIETASLPEFQLEEFAAVPRTFALNKSLRMLRNGNTDLKYFAIDCFHFSQYGNAALTNMLWNDMLQMKTKNGSSFLKPFETFACPSEEKPYISTLKNNY